MQSSSTPNKPENRDSGQQQEPNNNYRSTWNTYSGNSNLHTNETAVFNHSAANWLYQHNGSTQNKLTSANRPQYKDAQYTELNSAYDSTKNRTAYLMQNFVFNCEAADGPKYDDLSAEEFLSGSMGLLLSPNLPNWEAWGRLALLQFACHRLARYGWPVVRAFHHAAITQAPVTPRSGTTTGRKSRTTISKKASTRIAFDIHQQSFTTGRHTCYVRFIRGLENNQHNSN
uniref:Uncharacterized protein n=1 Tax=Branchiostoma floridae TaxID=7739 RepID=C3ZB00_BRAFL|eukprot:XP_002594026.1 hypothetical protein BRAFLDRAFT_68534 [Branchiostoma floridae]